MPENQPDIAIPELDDSFQLVNKKEFKKVQDDLRQTKKILDWTFAFVLAILAICVVAFITFLIDAWRFHAETYKDLKNTLELQQNIISNLKNTDLDNTIINLQKEIEKIKLQKNIK